jgi:hypothetical protein
MRDEHLIESETRTNNPLHIPGTIGPTYRLTDEGDDDDELNDLDEDLDDEDDLDDDEDDDDE